MTIPQLFTLKGKAIEHHQLQLPNTKAFNIGESYNQW